MMNKNYRKFLYIFVILFITINSCYSASCYAGRLGCIESCRLQNCATGYCTPESEPIYAKRTCVCSRCNNGPRDSPYF